MLHLIDISTFTFESGKRMLLPSILYFAQLYISTDVLDNFDSPMFSALERAVPVATVLLSGVITKSRCDRNRRLIVYAAIICLGSIASGYSTIEFDITSIVCGIIILALRSSALVLIEHAASSGKYSIWEMIYLNTFYGSVFLLLLDLVYYESQDAFTYMMASASYLFWITFACSLIGGLLFHWALFYCVCRSSAITTSVASNATSTLLLLVGHGLVLKVSNWFGVIISLAGCVLYAIYASDKSHSQFQAV